jgi:maltooligosyltrehalose trehalohydrolase
MALPQRRLPVGAEILPSGEAHFRVWAPRRRAVEVALEGGGGPSLSSEGNGYFSGTVREARAGALYKFRLDGRESFPDPASRFQPEGPHGPSQVVDPAAYRWRDGDWKGVALTGQVLYELHIGTFTTEGTWGAAARELPALRELGAIKMRSCPWPTSRADSAGATTASTSTPTRSTHPRRMRASWTRHRRASA